MAVSHLHLYRGQPELLEYLLAHGECSQVELSEALGVSPASVSHEHKAPLQGGLRRAEGDENDRRINRLSITENGSVPLWRGARNADRIDDIMFEGFTEQRQSSCSPCSAVWPAISRSAS